MKPQICQNQQIEEVIVEAIFAKWVASLSIACVAGFRRERERGFWAREKREGRPTRAPKIPFPLPLNTCHAG